MKVQGTSFRSIWAQGDAAVGIIDQRSLPFEFVTTTLTRCADVAEAIRSMQVRGAPLIGVAGAYGLALAMREGADDTQVARAYTQLLQARPTAVNLRWALDRVCGALARTAPAARFTTAWQLAGAMADEDVAQNRALGSHGARLLQEKHAHGGRTVNVLTHCNAGWLGTVDYGTALSAIYQAFDAGVPLHVWVDETRPRNQGLLTAWELAAHGVPHTLIADNTGGHLMQHGQVDVVIVGADRVSGNGDVCNKIGTYLKALAAFDNGIPFYAAVPSPTIDWTLADAQAEIEIEERAGDEVRRVSGRAADGGVATVAIAEAQMPVANPAFDVTPARLVSGIITERGIAAPAQLASLYPEQAATRRTPGTRTAMRRAAA